MAAIDITLENYQQYVTEGSKPVLLDFWAPWCTYCRRIEPAFEQIAEQYQDVLLAGKVNVDEAGELAVQHRVQVIPTLILFQNGEPVDKLVAPESRAEIEAFLKKRLQL